MVFGGGRIDPRYKTCSFSLQHCIGAQHVWIRAVRVAQAKLLWQSQEKTSSRASGASCRAVPNVFFVFEFGRRGKTTVLYSTL